VLRKLGESSKSFIVLCTGCAGHGRDQYLEKVLAEKFPREEEILRVRLRDEIYKHAVHDGIHLSDSTVLDIDEDRRARYREAAIESILHESSKFKYTFVSSPATFKWKGETIFGLRPSDVKRLDPDLFVTIVNDLLPAQQELSKQAQWNRIGFTLKDLADWREMEIRETRQMARQVNKLLSYFVIPSDHKSDVLYDLVVNRHKKKAYFSYPMTDATAEQIRQGQMVISKLESDLVFFDPYTIKDPYMYIELQKQLEKSGGKMPETLKVQFDYSSGARSYTVPTREIEEARKSINIQTVRLDHHLIAQSDMIVAYLPFPAAGVVSEMLFAHERGKPVFAYYPKHPSPFLDFTCTEIFKSAEELVEGVRKELSSHV
jgi:hypothetical protein